MNCDNDLTPGPNSPSVVKWLDTRSLGVLTDAAATALNTPGYAPLLQDNTTPFPIPAPVAAQFKVRFQLDVSPTFNTAPTVIGNKLVDALGADWLPPQHELTLRQLAIQGDLFFVHDQDDCWCKSMFQVKWFGGVYFLDTAEDPKVNCGCQETLVPGFGDKLDYGQYIIPAAYASDWALRNVNTSLVDPIWEFGPKCEDANGNTFPGCSYEFWPTDQAGIYYMKYAEREMTGTLIWPIRRKWYDAIKDRVDFMLACSRNCGAVNDKVFADGSLSKISEGCEVTFEDLQWTLQQENYPHPGEPGCLTEPGKLPWVEITCGGALCEGEGLRIYCVSLQHLETLLTKIPDQVKPFAVECDSLSNKLSSATECSFPSDPYFCGISASITPIVGGTRLTLTLSPQAARNPGDEPNCPFWQVPIWFSTDVCQRCSQIRVDLAYERWAFNTPGLTGLWFEIAQLDNGYQQLLLVDANPQGDPANSLIPPPSADCSKTVSITHSSTIDVVGECPKLSLYFSNVVMLCPTFNPGTWCSGGNDGTYALADTMLLTIDFLT